MLVRRAVVLFAVAVLMGAGSAYAQTIRARFDIPFKFNVGKLVLPAGAYAVESASPFSQPGMLVIRSQDIHHAGRRSLISANAVLSSKPVQDQTKLIFRCYDGKCFLSQVWTAGSDVGRQVMPSHQERLLAQRGPALRVPIFADVR